MTRTIDLESSPNTVLTPSQQLRVALSVAPQNGLHLGSGFVRALLAEVAALERQGGGADRVRAERLLAKADRQLVRALRMLMLAAVLAGFGFASVLTWVI